MVQNITAPNATAPVQSSGLGKNNGPTTDLHKIPAGTAGTNAAAERVLTSQEQAPAAPAPKAEVKPEPKAAPAIPGGPSPAVLTATGVAAAAAGTGTGAPEITAGAGSETAAAVVGQSWTEIAQTAAPYAIATVGGVIVANSVKNLVQKQPVKPEVAKIAVGSAIVVGALAPNHVASAYNSAATAAGQAYNATTTFVGQTYNDVAAWASETKTGYDTWRAAKWTAFKESDAVTGTFAAVSKFASGTVAFGQAAVSTAVDYTQSYGPFVGAVAGAALVTKSLSNLSNTTNSKAREIAKIAAGALVIAGSVYTAPADKKDVAITALASAYAIDKWKELRGNQLCGRALSTVKAGWISLKDSASALKEKAQTRINTWKRPTAPVANAKAQAPVLKNAPPALSAKHSVTVVGSKAAAAAA